MHNNLGVAYLKTSQFNLARQSFEESVNLEPENNYPAFANLGTIYFMEARFGLMHYKESGQSFVSKSHPAKSIASMFPLIRFTKLWQIIVAIATIFSLYISGKKSYATLILL